MWLPQCRFRFLSTRHANSARKLSWLFDMDDDAEDAAHLSDEDAIKFAMFEYLHVDCRLIHARQ
jgi:hypothetical protein